MSKEQFNLKEGCYVIIEHDDETLTMHNFKNLESVKQYVKDTYFEEDIKCFNTAFKSFFEDSYVDGDSYAAKNLFKFINNKLELVYGETDVKNNF